MGTSHRLSVRLSTFTSIRLVRTQKRYCLKYTKRCSSSVLTDRSLSLRFSSTSVRTRFVA